MHNPYKINEWFEEDLAEFCGSKYCVSCESCSAAIFMCCIYEDVKNKKDIVIPKYTYPSVPASIVNAGGRVSFNDYDWQDKGYYYLKNTRIIDSAKKLIRNMYPEFPINFELKIDESNNINADFNSPLVCLSFHAKKCLPIGRGGAVLTNDKGVYEWLKLYRFDGRNPVPLDKDTLQMAGMNFYMEPTQAARGLMLMQFIGDGKICERDPYQNLSVYPFFTQSNR